MAIDFLQSAVQFTRADDAQRRLELLEERLADWDFSLPDAVPLFTTLLSLPPSGRYPGLSMTPQRQKQKTFEAIVAFLLRAAERRPTRVIVEDLHWADPSILELLELMIEQVPRARLFLALAFRPEFMAPWPAQPQVTSISLRRLARSDIDVMVRSVAGGKALPVSLVDEIASKTEGVPLFIEELTRTVLESGLLHGSRAMMLVNQAMAELGDERFYQAELHRLKGELILQSARTVTSESREQAEDCFMRALEIARRQKAKALELRAATSLARLLDAEGRRDEARAMLAEIYGWFTEGFDTTDLKETKALLDEAELLSWVTSFGARPTAKRAHLKYVRPAK